MRFVVKKKTTEFKTLEQDIMEIFTKRNIEILSEEVSYDKKEKCFVWKIKGRNKNDR